MTKKQTKQPENGSQGYKFGTFAGVFTPSILTIFGLIMFMRTNYVVGQAGIYQALLILLIAELICIATGLSISAISTNTPVKGGGAYFLISRSLGPGFGSSIGMTLFFAQSLSVPFYILGFSEAMVKNFSCLEPYYFFLVTGTGLVIFFLTWIGADWVMKCQFFILTILGLSILSFLGGAAGSFSWETFSANQSPVANVNIFLLFAIFFPAVTGIMAGVNMSGDLKAPEKSLPQGTLLAITVGLVVYAIQMILCGGAFPRNELISQPYNSLVTNALFSLGFLVIAGVVCATLSSALGSCIGAPRVLQALARDRIIGVLNPFEKGSGPFNEPKRALLLTYIISFGVLLWGGVNGIAKEGEFDALNAVAKVVTMFFLYTYGMVNLAAFVESYGGNPSFRPRFKFYHWGTALFGAVSCIVVSFMIDYKASIFALFVISTIFVFTRRKVMKRTFGDARRGFVYTHIQKNLILLSKMPPDPKNWRPTITVLSGDPNNRKNLVDYAWLFGCDSGIISVTEFLVGNPLELIDSRRTALKRIEQFATENELDIFPEVIAVEDFDNGLRTFLQAHSIGPIKPNIVMLGWPRELTRVIPFAHHLRVIKKLDMNCIIHVNNQNKACPKLAKGRIDIWWRGMANGSLMLIMAHLLRSNRSWNQTMIRIIRTVSKPEQTEKAEEELTTLINSARISAKKHVVVSKESFESILKKESADATVIFMGFVPPQDSYAEKFYNDTTRRLADMPPVFLVNSTGEADLQA